MPSKNFLLLALGLLFFGGLLFFTWLRATNAPPASTERTAAVSLQPTGLTETAVSPETEEFKPTAVSSGEAVPLVAPVADFRQRITKKPFGIFITPATSPVQPEKFTGYHTGVDVEYEDVVNEVPVKAVADGNIVLSQHASGYGGIIAIQHTINNQPVISIYGHLRPSSLLPLATKVSAGQQIGFLGNGYSKETDGERKHLHFALLKGKNIDLRGYVEQKSDLSGWQDPKLVISD